MARASGSGAGSYKEQEVKLNLGSCQRNFPGFVSVDICEPADVIADLSLPWPWHTSEVEEVLALDIAEHISDCAHELSWCDRCKPRGERRNYPLGRKRHPIGRIHFMNELHRVLVSGGRATIETPNAARGVGFAQDPTHVSPFCLSTFKYFEHGSFAHGRLAASYGIVGGFKMISLTESRSNGENPAEEVWKIKAILETVKP